MTWESKSKCKRVFTFPIALYFCCLGEGFDLFPIIGIALHGEEHLPTLPPPLVITLLDSHSYPQLDSWGEGMSLDWQVWERN